MLISHLSHEHFTTSWSHEASTQLWEAAMGLSGQLEIHRPTDFAPYGIRLRNFAGCSCGCRHFVPLEGKEGAD